MNWFFVFIGGGLGSLSRYGIGLIFREARLVLPIGTLIANLIAALVIGILYFSGLKQRQEPIWLLLATGFCGGLSTFSAFSLETFELIRHGETTIAMLNVTVSLFCCLLLIWGCSLLIR
jgi:fluoride exporter